VVRTPDWSSWEILSRPLRQAQGRLSGTHRRTKKSRLRG
jgi:hypothetical protein